VTLWWKDAWCPRCEAAPGRRCVSANGLYTTTHVDRHREGNRVHFGRPVTDEFPLPDDWEDFIEEFTSEDEEEYMTTTMPPPTYRAMVTVYLPGDAP
jgi:hypothetical protein